MDPKRFSRGSWFSRLVHKYDNDAPFRLSHNLIIALMVTCKAFRHFKVTVASFFISLWMTLILGINLSISCKNFRCGESDVIALQYTLRLLIDELFRQSNVLSSFEINSAVPHADDGSCPRLR